MPTPDLVDTHCHLDDPKFDSEPIAEILSRAAGDGVHKVVTIGIDLPSSRAAAELAAAHDGLWAAVALDPKHLDGFGEGAVAELAELAARPEVVAIGEIGLDYHWDAHPRPQQREAFKRQLALAAEVGLPVVIHNRDADRDTADILEDWAAGIGEADLLGARKRQGRPLGVLHCYSGDLVLAEELFDAGFLISVSGIVTYSGAKRTHDVAAGLAQSALVIETDAPYLTPRDKGKRRNEPAWVRLVAERVAELRGTDLKTVAGFTSRNAGRLFGWPTR